MSKAASRIGAWYPPPMPGNDSRLVYSSDGDGSRDFRKTPNPGNRRMPAPPATHSGPRVPDDGVVRIQRDRKGRGGKTATVVTGLPGSEAELDALLKTLKQSCATGGTREGRTLILQGDQRERLMERLTALGHRPRLAGG